MAQISAAELARQKSLEELAKEGKEFDKPGLNCGACTGQNCNRCNITSRRWVEVKYGARVIRE